MKQSLVCVAQGLVYSSSVKGAIALLLVELPLFGPSWTKRCLKLFLFAVRFVPLASQ